MSYSIERAPFGSTGHNSSRAIFGAAALGAMSQERADRTLDLMASYGLNHIDVAASYGEAELRLAPWLAQHRNDVFLATKTGHRTAARAKQQLHESLERMQVDQIDLIQMHNHQRKRLADRHGARWRAGSPGRSQRTRVSAVYWRYRPWHLRTSHAYKKLRDLCL